MINIFFVPGMFASTLEYMLRNYTVEHESVKGYITDDGSMHSFKKEFHPNSMNKLVTFFQKDIKISTPIYPFTDAKLDAIIKAWPGDLHTAKNIFVHAPNLEAAELNILFQYYKVSKGVANTGLQIFCGDNSYNIVNWNDEYTHWSQMEAWELREWLSIFYPVWIQEWIDIADNISGIDNRLEITNTEMLADPVATFTKIAEFCGLTIKHEYEDFIKEWISKQEYIVNEFNLLQAIEYATINQEFLQWDNLCFLSEAIIQQRLRSKGYKIKCFGLNTFPKDSKSLYNLLEKQ